MADHIPFVYTRRDCDLVKRLYADSVAIRFTLEGLPEISSHLPSGPIRWVDPAVDGLHRWPQVTSQYETHIRRFRGADRLAEPEFQKKPDKELVQQFVSDILDECNKHSASWFSIPQLPCVSDATRNKINRLLAEAAGIWKASQGFQGKLILPVILTHQKQVNRKTERNKRIDLVKDCIELSRADGVWVVESSLSDQDGSTTFEHLRFPGVINFHQELNQILQNEVISVAGPYWGMNMILWARTLVRFPAIGLGNSYQYHLPGGVLMPGKKRIALPPLRRWAVATSQLENWLKRSLKQLNKDDPTFGEFSKILQHFSQLSLDGRNQVAEFYKMWFDRIAANPEAGRALALYHDLSSAYVVGKSLPDLPSAEGTGNKPWRVPKQFMVNCL